MLSDQQLIHALRDCYDPAIPCNIVDLGLILHTSITLDPAAPGANIPGVPQQSLVHIDLILTDTSAAAEAHTRTQIVNRLAGLETVIRTTVTVHDQPRWSPNRITPAGRRILGLEGNPALIQIR